MSHNKQSRKYLIGRSYKNDEFDWPLLFGYCIVAWHENITTVRIEAGSTSHLRMAAMLNGPTGGAKTIDL